MAIVMNFLLVVLLPFILVSSPAENQVLLPGPALRGSSTGVSTFILILPAPGSRHIIDEPLLSVTTVLPIGAPVVVAAVAGKEPTVAVVRTVR